MVQWGGDPEVQVYSLNADGQSVESSLSTENKLIFVYTITIIEYILLWWWMRQNKLVLRHKGQRESVKKMAARQILLPFFETIILLFPFLTLMRGFCVHAFVVNNTFAEMQSLEQWADLSLLESATYGAFLLGMLLFQISFVPMYLLETTIGPEVYKSALWWSSWLAGGLFVTSLAPSIFGVIAANLAAAAPHENMMIIGASGSAESSSSLSFFYSSSLYMKIDEFLHNKSAHVYPILGYLGLVAFGWVCLLVRIAQYKNPRWGCMLQSYVGVAALYYIIVAFALFHFLHQSTPTAIFSSSVSPPNSSLSSTRGGAEGFGSLISGSASSSSSMGGGGRKGLLTSRARSSSGAGGSSARDTVEEGKMYLAYADCGMAMILPLMLWLTLREEAQWWRAFALQVMGTRRTMSGVENIPIQTAHQMLREHLRMIDFTELDFLGRGGSGASGSVYRCRYQGQLVAAKTFLEKAISISDLLRVAKEAFLCHRVRHPHVVEFLGMCVSPPNLYLVFEWCTHRSLLNMLLDLSNTKLPWRTRVRFALEVAKGLNALHKIGAVHRDVKTENILVTLNQNGRFTCKLCDFGSSRLIATLYNNNNNNAIIAGATDSKIRRGRRRRRRRGRNSTRTTTTTSTSTSHNSCTNMVIDIAASSDNNNNNTTTTTTAKEAKMHSNRFVDNKTNYNYYQDSYQNNEYKGYLVDDADDDDDDDKGLRHREIPSGSTASRDHDGGDGCDNDDSSDNHHQQQHHQQQHQQQQQHFRLDLDLYMQKAFQEDRFLTGLVGTPAYMAPELLQNIHCGRNTITALSRKVPYGQAIDVFSFAYVMWELLTRRQVYSSKKFTFKEIHTQVLAGKTPSMPPPMPCQTLHSDFTELMRDCWLMVPAKRPTTAHLVRKLKGMYQRIKHIQKSETPAAIALNVNTDHIDYKPLSRNST